MTVPPQDVEANHALSRVLAKTNIVRKTSH
ncbi:hypothetical protein MUBE_03050 [Mycobacterium uberis]|uniref:Uncharacterized protein n=1 Tax=Mycobacterium uberis TaxID=2162698 RepID=A0A3E1HKN4_9MYCO|nr:hypothetical protein MUBE_03050 [Mycobacterium uberis]